MTDIEKCEREISKLRTAAVELATKKAAATHELTQLRATLGESELEAHLTGGDTKKLRAKIFDLETAIEGYSGAREVLTGRILRAMQGVNQAKAAELRAESKRLQTELTKRLEKTGELLKQLTEWEGCSWRPAPPPSQRIEIATSAGGAMGAGIMTRSDLVAQQVRQLAQQASATEARQISTAGEVEGATIEALLAVTESSNIIGPVRIEVEDWTARAEAAAIAAWEAGPGRDPQLQYRVIFRLMWKNGMIDEQRSRCVAMTVDPLSIGYANEAERMRAASVA